MGLKDARTAQVVPLHSRADGSDASLVAAARKGQSWAREALYRRHIRRVLAIAYRLAPEEDPEDVAQEVFLRVLPRLHTLTDAAAFGGWVAAVTVSQVRMRLRKKRWLRRIGLGRGDPIDPDQLVSADAPEAVRVQVRDLYQVVARLPEEERIALVLQRVEGLELSEVAERMGLSVATVKRRVSAAERVLAEVGSDG